MRSSAVRLLRIRGRTAGVHNVFWDGRDDDGKELASGVYLYQLRAKARVLTQKLLLLR